MGNFGKLILGMAAAVLIAGTAQAEPVTIRVGYNSLPAQMIPALFKLEGVLKHNGTSYVVEPVSFGGSSLQVTALAADEVDLALLGPTALATAVTNAGLDLRVVLDNAQDGRDNYYSQTFYVKADSGINTVQDLKGKSIGVNAVGSASDTMLRAMLLKEKIDPSTDVKIVEVSAANQLAMIDDGKIDATTIPIPMVYKLIDEGKYKPLFSSRDAIGTTQFGFLTAKAEFLEKNRAAVMDMAEDYVRAMRWFNDPKNREAALPIIAEVSKRDLDGVSHMFTEKDYYRDPFGMPSVEGIQRTIDISQQLGLLATGLEVSPKYIDLSFSEEAKKRIEANP